MAQKYTDPALKWLFSRKLWVALGVILFCGLTFIISTNISKLSKEASPVEMSILGRSALAPGQTTHFRVQVRDAKKTKPIANASVHIRLLNAKGKEVAKQSGKTDSTGILLVKQTIPEHQKPGSYRFEVTTTTPQGKNTLNKSVKVQRSYKILLNTDKPLYQPGQKIHIRTLTLGTLQLKPAAHRTQQLSIKDSKGNTVFKQILQTSKYGITSASFQLANQVNTGRYTIIAVQGDTRSEREVEVRRYTLPRFKVGIQTDQTYYRPGSQINLAVRARYTFGKPVAKGKVKVVLSSFIASFSPFKTLHCTTDAKGLCKLSHKLPTYFASTGLEKNIAKVRIHTIVTDGTGEEQQKVTFRRVTNKSLHLSLFPENGKLIPGIKNVIYLVTSFPDGRPAKSTISMDGWTKPLQTSSLGIASFTHTPKVKNTRETFSFNVQAGGEKHYLTETLENGQQHTFILRTDRPVYRAGETVKIRMLSSQKTDRIFLDLVKAERTMMMKVIKIKDGKGILAFDLPHDLVGTLDLQAYKLLDSGKIIRINRVIQVNPANDLSVQVALDKKTYRPGQKAKVQIQITDSKGKPVQAALSLSAVDEAVFALNAMRPGMERTYFAIQQELLKPRYQLTSIQLAARRSLYTPAGLTKQPIKPTQTKAKERQKERRQARSALMALAGGKASSIKSDGTSYKTRIYRLQREKRVVRASIIMSTLSLPWIAFFLFGVLLLFQCILIAFRNQPTKSKDDEAIQVYKKTTDRMLFVWLVGFYAPLITFILYVSSFYRMFHSRYHREVVGFALMAIPVLICVVLLFQTAMKLKDNPIAQSHPLIHSVIRLMPFAYLCGGIMLFTAPFFFKSIEIAGGIYQSVIAVIIGSILFVIFFTSLTSVAFESVWREINILSWSWLLIKRSFQMFLPALAIVFIANMTGCAKSKPGRLLRAAGSVIATGMDMNKQSKALMGAARSAARRPGGAEVRVRRHFPETLVWNPEVITDTKGKLSLEIPLADSITTWRLSTSAVSAQGSLGHKAQGIRVFQPFFVDLTMPSTLTQNDELSLPIAIFNYLKETQKITLTPQKADWFELLEGDSKTITLQANQVTKTSFRIRIKKPGQRKFLIRAIGSKMSDAIERIIRIKPDGKAVLTKVNATLKKEAKHTFEIPQNAIPGANDLFLKIYPGSFSQVVEGLDNIFRMPYGCFEQTSSTTYPNVMVLRYMRQTKKIRPTVELKAMKYINQGYQRLLSFEVSGGGFSLYGKSPAKVYLSAYGLMEFYDMSKVHNVDPGVLRRTRSWLYRNQSSDGSWSSKSSYRHRGNTLLLTSYVAWALAKTGQQDHAFNKALQYMLGRKGCTVDLNQRKDAYQLAMCANVFVAAKRLPQARKILRRLAKLVKRKKQLYFWQPDKSETGISYSRGHSLAIETTALAASAMLLAKEHISLAHGALRWLTKGKDRFGTWYSTQPTVQALRALILGTGPGSSPVKKPTYVQIFANKQLAKKVLITTKTSDVLHLVDLRKYTKKGKNQVSLKTASSAALSYQLVGTHYLPHAKVPNPTSKSLKGKPMFSKMKPLDISVSYSTKELSRNDHVICTVRLQYNFIGTARMPLVILGIPPGFSPETKELEVLKKKDIIQRYQIAGSQITLYMDRLERGKPITFKYRLRALYPVRVQTPKTQAYLYYQPEIKAQTTPTTLIIR